jgi:hypothetical protein
MAEKVRFELTEAINLGGFQDRCLKPLGHLSKSGYFYSTLISKTQRLRPRYFPTILSIPPM